MTASFHRNAYCLGKLLSTVSPGRALWSRFQDYKSMRSRKRLSVEHSALVVALTMLFCGCTISRTKQAATQAIVAKFSELSPDDKARLRQQREIIVTAAKQPYGTAALTKAVADLPLLQRLIDDKAFGKTPGHRTVSTMGHG